MDLSGGQVIEQRQLYGWADLVFYETPAQWAADQDRFAAADREPPAGWARTGQDVWVSLKPEGVELPAQGWKIHISAVAADAERIVETTWSYCVEREIPFKFLRDRHLFRMYNSKYMPRQASGKLVTIYPADDEQLRRTLEELASLLQGTSGPYILSDLRWGEGPLHVRYGGFRTRFCTDAKGDRVLAIEDADGTLVPDERRPGHYAPPWVEVPDFLRPHLERRRSGSGSFPYRVLRALHFSNGGGVYLAERLSDNRQVVLKEARPGAGLDMSGRDAVERLERERWALERLAGIPGIPRLHDSFQADGHHFLAMEHMAGDVLWLWLATYHPMVHFGTGRAEEAAYTARAVDVADRLEALLAAAHERGVVFGDLHPGNVLITPDGELSLIDFEAAFEASEESARPALGAQGFLAPPGVTGTAVDRYALAMLRLWLFLPVNRLFPLSRTKLAETIDTVERRFADLPDGFIARLREDTAVPARPGTAPAASPLPAALVRRRSELLDAPLDVDLDAPEPDWDAVGRSLTEAILLSATPERTDRLFPGDVQQFLHDGLNLAHGAAGVLWALHATGAGRFPEHERWLLDALARGPVLRRGFYSGRYGIAYVLDQLGHADEAAKLLADAGDAPPTVDAGLYGGTAGEGLTHLYFADRYDDAGHLEQARLRAGRIERLLNEPGHPAAPTAARAGLMHGWSGCALFLQRMYEADGDPRHLDLAFQALHRDLEVCVTRSNGSVQVADRGIRTLAYLEVGSGGIALVADELLTARPDPGIEELLPAVRRACQTEYVAEPHLLNGRSGLMATAARLAHRDPGTEARDAVRRHLKALTWHKLAYRGRLAFPGDQTYRLSMDLATGNAGVLLGVRAAVDGTGPFLPFFTPRPVVDGSA
ncbi:class III lanthionine synthetase LanKC [Streptomyces sp. NPDC007808]|uniref:class III lanthionine synthetase LanKC n=1 Tax=Streptomyces sp. NPDC007808 TaxID=3364779 RepID=UPI0036AE9764